MWNNLARPDCRYWVWVVRFLLWWCELDDWLSLVEFVEELLIELYLLCSLAQNYYSELHWIA